MPLGSGQGHRVGKFKSKTDYYRHRLVTEKPKLRDGRPYKIHKGGYFIEVPSRRSMNGHSTFYVACDFPRLFGWEIPYHKPRPAKFRVEGTLLCMSPRRVGKVTGVMMLDNGRAPSNGSMVFIGAMVGAMIGSGGSE